MPEQSPAPGQSAEVERKFALERSRRVPPLDAAPSVRSVGEPHRFTQVAVYYDTLDLDLLRAKVTLRRRTGGTDDGWHLKLPGGADERTEVALPLTPRDDLLVPAALRAQVADVVRSAALVPVAVLSTRRSVRELRGLRGKVLAELMDDTVTAHLPGAEPHAEWRELELELVQGEREVFDEVGAILAEAGIEPSQSPSKAAQALAPRLAALTEAGPGSPAGEVLVRYLASQVGVLQSRVDDLRADTPDAVHKTRVATRRIRSLLKTFRPVFDRAATDPVRDELKWFAGVLGAPRDAEVQRDHLIALVGEIDPSLVSGPVEERLRTELTARHAMAHTALVNTMEGKRYEDLMKALVRLVSEPPLTELAGKKAKKVLPGLVASQEKAVVKLAGRADAAEGDERDVLLHEVRKSAKAARYACEALPALGDEPGRSAKAWEQVTEALGAHQDSFVARETLIDMAEAARGHREDTFTYGVLHQVEVSRAVLAEDDYKPALRLARSKKVSGWTRG